MIDIIITESIWRLIKCLRFITLTSAGSVSMTKCKSTSGDDGKISVPLKFLFALLHLFDSFSYKLRWRFKLWTELALPASIFLLEYCSFYLTFYYYYYFNVNIWLQMMIIHKKMQFSNEAWIKVLKCCKQSWMLQCSNTTII